MNLKEIKEMINLMNENGLTEIEIEREGTKIKIRKGSAGMIDPILKRHAEFQVETIPSAMPAVEHAAATQKSGKNTAQIASPMVGTFYRSPSPEAPPFIDVGQIVEVGQVVCIIEAMKLMNEIKSEVRGKIVEIPVQNAEPVEFGQTLFAVEPL